MAVSAAQECDAGPELSREESDTQKAALHVRSRSVAVFAITIFMIASPYPVQETPPAVESA
jgi:hypothetical protein